MELLTPPTLLKNNLPHLRELEFCSLMSDLWQRNRTLSNVMPCILLHEDKATADQEEENN